jgi:hypothetical protein
MASDSSKTLYNPGQVIPRAGIYRVLHEGHRLPHKATFKAEERFPSCKKCGANVRFELLLAAENEAKNGRG